MRRRSAARASRERVKAFSLTSNCCRAASHSSSDVIAGVFIATGSFLFKAEPVDQHGNLIDRHNLWEMVGVRFRRSLFPGYSDTVEYEVDCSGVGAVGAAGANAPRSRQIDVPKPQQAGKYTVTAILQYRKVDQFLTNYLLGENSGITAPVVEIGRATAVFEIVPATASTQPSVVRLVRTGN